MDRDSANKATTISILFQDILKLIGFITNITNERIHKISEHSSTAEYNTPMESLPSSTRYG
jgi:hypothetical protein